MIFLTVGSEFHFDRLVRAVDALLAGCFLKEEVVAQIGCGGYEPQHMRSVSTMSHSTYVEHVRASSAVISHAGMGTIIQCLQLDKPLLVLPRLERHKEIVNDHQIATARKFEQRGSILAAYDTADLPLKIAQLKGFRPTASVAESRRAVVDRINRFLERQEPLEASPLL
jgi:UDP-N-acetylglucosamine transferase subunit ALG13